MIDKSVAHQTEPIIATVTPNTARSDGYIIPNYYNPAIRSLASDKGVALADQYAAMASNWTSYNSGDGLHISDAGERVMAQTWLNVMDLSRINSTIPNIAPIIKYLLE
jgi:lysophospholipase L1-like esterase